MRKHSKANCIGCDLSLKDRGQCSRCHRCLDCCGNENIAGSCIDKYMRKDPRARKRSDDAYDRWQTNPAILSHNRRIN
jgi:hypothetical protein